MTTISDLDLGSHASRIAETCTDRLAARDRLMRELGYGSVVRDLLTGIAPVRVPPNVPPRNVAELHGYAFHAAVYRAWTRGKMVYAVHPDMVAELADSASRKLPGDIFEMIPHTNPFIVFPRPVPTTSPEGHTADVLGFVVYGRFNNLLNICSTHDDQRDGLGLMFFTTQRDESGAAVRDEVISAVVPTTHEVFTVKQAVQESLDIFEAGPLGTLHGDQLQRWLADLLRLAINTLLYTCTDDPDLTETKSRRPRKQKGRSTRRPTRSAVIRVGWRLGPALRRLRHRAAVKYAATGTGREQPTHQRRCHLRTYWVGPGRQKSIVKFIKPYWVRLDRLEGADYRVIPVRRLRSAKTVNRGTPTATARQRP